MSLPSAEAEPVVNRARSAEAPSKRCVRCLWVQYVCDHDENTPLRLPRKTEVEKEGFRE